MSYKLKSIIPIYIKTVLTCTQNQTGLSLQKREVGYSFETDRCPKPFSNTPTFVTYVYFVQQSFESNDTKAKHRLFDASRADKLHQRKH